MLDVPTRTVIGLANRVRVSDATCAGEAWASRRLDLNRWPIQPSFRMG